MNRSSLGLSAALLSLSWAIPGYADEAADGQKLHDDNCVRCHDSQVYTRADRKVTSLAELEAQVRRCDSALGTQWFDEDMASVVQYLNERYYKF